MCAVAFAGAMYPTSMRINEEGRLVVNFKTEARYRGQFVMSHPGMQTLGYSVSYLASVTCDRHTSLMIDECPLISRGCL